MVFCASLKLAAEAAATPDRPEISAHGDSSGTDSGKAPDETRTAARQDVSSIFLTEFIQLLMPISLRITVDVNADEESKCSLSPGDMFPNHVDLAGDGTTEMDADGTVDVLQVA